MCGIGGAVSLTRAPVGDLDRCLATMNALLEHRGPDGEGTWRHDSGVAGLAMRRLAIIDLQTGQQPMSDEGGNQLVHNGEIYNYVELRQVLGEGTFRTTSDTEVILRSYRAWGEECLDKLRGMWAFAIWDDATDSLFLARDRFGIKPMYYTVAGDVFYFASEIKALLPFVPEIATDLDGFKDYLSFQFCIGAKTLFGGIFELPPGHFLRVRNGVVDVHRYWEVYYEPDFEHTDRYFNDQARALVEESIDLHLRADVPIGAYVSGGLDSSIVASLASLRNGTDLIGFNGRFLDDPAYDESVHARELAALRGFRLEQIDIGPRHFVERIEDVVYHLDFPVAGPGSFAQFMVSELAAQSRKVVLGGQGGDEIFGGYVRYLIAYFEQCIKGAIEGTMHSGNFVVTYESIIPNLVALQGYKPLLQEFWRDGLFGDPDARYYRLINRSPALGDEINWAHLGDYSPFESFRQVFHGANVHQESYFDAMTHFDFKTLLPALLQVEDRVSMAHGLESRVPLLDHRVVELAATMPADVKFKDGHMKHVLKQAFADVLPEGIRGRTDKMGFPVPLQEWIARPGEVRDFVFDIFGSQVARERALVDNRKVLAKLDDEPRFGRKVWGLLSLELWHRAFHDRAAEFRRRTDEVMV